MKFDIYNFEDKRVLESIDVDLGKIEAERLNERLLATHLNRMKANHLGQRRAKTKNQSEVHGTTAKMYKQKGTGNARHGSKKACIFVGGGTMFGPRGGFRHVSLPKGEVRKVKRMLLALAIAGQKFFVVSDFAMKDHKTVGMVNRLQNFVDASKNRLKCLMIYEGSLDKNNELSARNLRGVKYASVKDFTVHNLVDADFVMITKEAVGSLSSCLQ